MTIKEQYPNVESIHIKLIDTPSKWDDLHRKREWYFNLDRELDFKIDCRFSQCYGNSGIDYSRDIHTMLRNKECHKTIKSKCGGHSERSLQYSCDNYVILEIEITYSE